MKKSTLLVGGAIAAALVVGTGGGAYAAAKITGADIVNGSITGVDVKNGSLSINDLNSNSVLALKGAKGDKGDKGANGTDGTDGTNGTDGTDGTDGKDAKVPAAGAGYADYPEANPHHDLWAPHSYGETIQVCKPGEHITGGGYSSFGGFQDDPSKDLGGNNKDVVITVSAPYIASDAAYVPISDSDSRFHADRWVVRGYNNSDSPVDIRAWALCS